MSLNRIQLKLIGWQGPAGGILALISSIILVWTWQQQKSFLQVERVVEIIVPLGFGLHSAFLCSVEIENKMEILVTCLKSLQRIFLERYVISTIIWSAIGFFGMVFTSLLLARPLTGEDFIRWFSSAVFLSGIGLYTTVVTRQGVFGVFVAFLMWIGMLLGGNAICTRFPIFELIHVYLQPQMVSPIIYRMNRIILFLGGISLVIVALMDLRNEERILA